MAPLWHFRKKRKRPASHQAVQASDMTDRRVDRGFLVGNQLNLPHSGMGNQGSCRISLWSVHTATNREISCLPVQTKRVDNPDHIRHSCGRLQALNDPSRSPIYHLSCRGLPLSLYARSRFRVCGSILDHREFPPQGENEGPASSCLEDRVEESNQRL